MFRKVENTLYILYKYIKLQWHPQFFIWPKTMSTANCDCHFSIVMVLHCFVLYCEWAFHLPCNACMCSAQFYPLKRELNSIENEIEKLTSRWWWRRSNWKKTAWKNTVALLCRRLKSESGAMYNHSSRRAGRRAGKHAFVAHDIHSDVTKCTTIHTQSKQTPHLTLTSFFSIITCACACVWLVVVNNRSIKCVNGSPLPHILYIFWIAQSDIVCWAFAESQPITALPLLNER